MSEHLSNRAWLVLGASVAAYDYFAPEGETLSEAFDRALEKPLTRYLAIGTVGTVALHLLNVLPPEIDPIHKLAERFRNDR